MNWLDAFVQIAWHVANFLAPACGMACVLGGALKLRGTRAPSASFGRIWSTLFGLGVAVSVLGMALTGLDGAMATYVVLVLVTGAASAWFAKL